MPRSSARKRISSTEKRERGRPLAAVGRSQASALTVTVSCGGKSRRPAGAGGIVQRPTGFRPAAAPLVDGLPVEPAALGDFGMGKVRVCGQHQGKPGAQYRPVRGGSPSGGAAGFGELLFGELGLMGRFR